MQSRWLNGSGIYMLETKIKAGISQGQQQKGSLIASSFLFRCDDYKYLSMPEWENGYSCYRNFRLDATF